MPWLVETLCVLMATAPTPVVAARFVQITPVVRPRENFARSPGQTRAVVLIPGLSHPLARQGEAKPKFHSYENPDSPLVKRLAQEADVYAFAYAETVSVTEVGAAAGLVRDIESLRTAGYTEIVLVGFSAGGLIAREFVEDYPDSPVGKVVQVCTPNAGTFWATAGRDDFVRSLTGTARRVVPGKRIPDAVQFACVVATGLFYGDGVVSIRSQWPPDLQEQGVPARMIRAGHLVAAHTPAGVALIAQLVAEPQPRWDAVRVATMRKALKKFVVP
jgi:pimeloyl-ACP methyl ester carboxylesterase